jgi:hypothetical protein
MNNVPVVESSDLAFELPLPDEYFPLWRCIACGAIGNSNPCMGVCDYHKLEVVRSVEYAELLDEVAVIMEHLKKLTALVHRIADLPEEESERENSYRNASRLRAQSPPGNQPHREGAAKSRNGAGRRPASLAVPYLRANRSTPDLPWGLHKTHRRVRARQTL